MKRLIDNSRGRPGRMVWLLAACLGSAAAFAQAEPAAQAAAAVLPAVAALTVPLIVPVVRENSASSP